MGNSQKRKLSKKRGGAGEVQQENAPQVNVEQPPQVNVEQPPQVNVEQPPEVNAPEIKVDAARPANCPPCPVGEEAPRLSKAQQAEDIVKGAHASVLNAITGNAASLKDKVTGTGQGLVAKLNTLVGNDETKAAAPVAGGGRRRTRKRSRRGKKSRKSKRKTSKRSKKSKRSSKRRY
jgi:hypothetical protein